MPSQSRARTVATFVATFAALASVTALAAPSQATGGGSIAVLVKDGDTRLGGVDLNLYKQFSSGGWYMYDSRETKDTGRYKFTGLSPGKYRVCASEYTPEYFAHCWTDGTDVNSARTMHLAAGQAIKTRRINLVKAGTISGMVSGSGPTSEAVELAVVNGAGHIVQAIRASIGTMYKVGHLESGSYRVQFEHASTGSRYAGQFFDGVFEGAGAGQGLGSATPVSVTTGANTPNVNATMTTGGSIAGFTKTTTGHPIKWCDVIAIPVADDGKLSSRYDASSATGRFVITGLSPGSYKVVVLGCVNVEKWYKNKPKNVTTTKGDADPVAVTEGNTTGIGILRVKAG